MPRNGGGAKALSAPPLTITVVGAPPVAAAVVNGVAEAETDGATVDGGAGCCGCCISSSSCSTNGTDKDITESLTSVLVDEAYSGSVRG